MDGSGRLQALDRVPWRSVLKDARSAADAHGGKLLLCVGGNARSAGFSPTVAKKSARKRFIAALMQLIEKNGLDGIDYNW